MRVTCPTCSTAYNLDEKKVPPGGAKLKCSKCQSTFPVAPSSADAAAVPLPGTAPAAVPLPGAAPPSPFEPVPHGAVPLPGTSASRMPPPAAGAVPLPGSPAGAAVPPPGIPSSSAVPLPGALPSNDLEFSDFSPPVPPPFQAPVAGGFETGSSDPFGFDAAPPPPSPPAANVADPLGDPLDFLGNAPPPPPPPAGPAPVADPLGGLDFEQLDLPSSPPKASAPPPPPAPVRPDPFSGDVDLLNFDAPIPPPAPPLRAPVPASAAGGDDMEFDPTAPAKPKDDLEADLSAPVPPRAAPSASASDDLELLDFIDDAAAQSKAKQKPRKEKAGGFQVRNKQSKVLGPWSEPDITKMLGEGKLLGNEDISQDGETWTPLGSHPVFAEVLQRIMEAPGAPKSQDEAVDRPPIDANERIKQIYGGRMAGITIVDTKSSVDKIRKKIPLILGTAAAAAVLAFGIYLGFTPWGLFGFKRLFPTTVKPGSALYQKLVDGSAELDHATFGSLKRAADAAEQVLKINGQVVEARALFARATFAQQQLYGAADAASVARAHKYVEELWAASPGRPGVLEAKVAEELLLGVAEQQRPALEKAFKDRPKDAQLALLLGRSYAKAKDDVHAKALFEKAEGLAKDPAPVLTEHAAYFSAKRDYADAAALLEKATKLDPKYASAALDLATLRVGKLAEPERAEDLLKPLEGLPADELSPEEQARIHALLGMIRVFEKKPEEAEAEFKQAQKLAPSSAAVQSAQATYLLRRHDYDGAEPLFQAAYQHDPNDLDDLDGLVSSMVGSGHLVDASKVLAEADARMPGNPRVAYLEGRVSDSADKLDEAEKDYKRAIAANAKLVKATLALGRFYLRHHRVKDAKDVLAQALKDAPRSSDANTAWGEVALAEGRTDDALATFEQAIKLDSDNPVAHLGRAQVMLAKGELAGAHREAEAAIKQDDKMPGGHRVFGAVLQGEKDNKRAQDELNVALKQDPKDLDASLRLGEVLYAMGDFDGAQNQLENAQTLDPDNADVHFYLALSHYKKRDSTQAIDEMTKALFAAPNRPELHYNFGLIYRMADGHYSDALDELRQAIKLKPDYADAHEALADALSEANDFTNAVDHYQKAMQADPARTQLLGKIGDCYAKASQSKKAIEAFEQHLKVDPKAISDYFKIGRAYDDLGKREQAIAAYREAAAKDKDNPQVYYYLGYALKERGKAREAIEAFRSYLRLNPKGEDASQIQDEIDGLNQDLAGQ